MFEVCPNEHLKKTKWMANGIDPLGIRSIIYKIYSRYSLPIIITENGMAYSDVLENNQYPHYDQDYNLREKIQWI